jgi:hypothetical protein
MHCSIATNAQAFSASKVCTVLTSSNPTGVLAIFVVRGNQRRAVLLGPVAQPQRMLHTVQVLRVFGRRTTLQRKRECC